MTSHIQFNYMTMSMSAYDAARLITNEYEPLGGGREFQLARAADGDPHHEIEFHLDIDPKVHAPGDPVSPTIKSAELSQSRFYVDFRFEGTPVYMTIPATSTVTIGWLERETHDA